MDNRVSLYAAQYGKCAVTGKVLWIDEIHCHHKKPISQGGTDEYKNLILLISYWTYGFISNISYHFTVPISLSNIFPTYCALIF